MYRRKFFNPRPLPYHLPYPLFRGSIQPTACLISPTLKLPISLFYVLFPWYLPRLVQRSVILDKGVH